jgi:FAD/FMN-containing dehydrogenase
MASVDPAAVAELRGMLGAPAVLTGEDDVARYQEPARGAAGAAAFVARPHTVDDVRAVLRWAWRHGVRLVPQGANTGLVGASVPDAGGGTGVLSLEKVTGGLVVDPADRTAVVPAGLRLSALEEHLAPLGLTFPIDLPADPSIGGMVATNTGGARMVAYGGVRRYVLGVELVLADEHATVVDLLHPLRKDNTGLALHQLVVGSGGALGVVTRVALEVVPRPAARATWWLAPRHDAAVPALLAHLERHRPGLLTAFELCSKAALDAVLGGGFDVADPFAGGTRPDTALLVEFSGAEDVDGHLLDALDAALDDAVADARRVPPAQAWAVRHAVPEALRRQGHLVAFDVATPRSALMAFRAEARAVVAAGWPAATVADFGHAGDGGLHFNLVFPAHHPLGDDESARLRTAVYEVVRRHGGSFSAEHGVGPANARWWTEFTPEPVRHLTARLVDLFDPRALLGHPALPYRSEGPPP